MNWYKKTSSTIRLWLDDERNPQDPFIQQNFGASGNEIWIKTVEEAIPYLEQNNVESISLDHDLGEGLKSGYDLAKYIEEKAFHGELDPLEWRVHSQNPSGAKNISQAMQSAERFWNDPRQEKQASLDVKVLSADSWGNLSLLINNKKYEYKLPYTAEETGRDILKARGSKLSKWIKWLDQFIVNKEDEPKEQEQMTLPFPR